MAGRAMSFAFLLCTGALFATTGAVRSNSNEAQVHVNAHAAEDDDVDALQLGYPDCTTAAKQLYRGDDSREMTAVSCRRADIIMRNLTKGAKSCHWNYVCDKQKALGATEDQTVCWDAGVFAVGVCQDETSVDPVLEEETEDGFDNDKDVDVSGFFNMTVDEMGENEMPPGDDPFLKPAPEEKPWERTCCKVCRRGLACGHSCISRKKTCSKGLGCACQETQ